MEESFKEFKDKIVKNHGPKKMKVVNSWGVYDAYKAVRKHGWYDIGRPVTEHEFYSIVRQVNDYLASELKQGNTIIFPYRMGKLELRRTETGASLIDGVLHIKYPIDWGETLRLWYKDKEAKEQKILIRHQTKYRYFIHYNKYRAVYNNRTFYKFSLNRFISKGLKDTVKNGKEVLW